MAIYKTYKEAVLANGSAKYIMQLKTTESVSYGFVVLRGDVTSLKDELGVPFHQIECTFCNPADYLESISDFHARGLQLRKFDFYVETDGSVQCINFPDHVNKPDKEDHLRFVLQAAAAYQVETTEEKGAFDSIDTTPQQVESLSGSEKPNNSEWKNGETLLWKNGNGEFLECNTGRYIGYDVKAGFHIYARTDKNVYQIGYAYRDDIKKPETPAEREERERLEAAYDLYCKCGVQRETVSFDKFKVGDCQRVWLGVVDETGYRKKED